MMCKPVFIRFDLVKLDLLENYVFRRYYAALNRSFQIQNPLPHGVAVRVRPPVPFLTPHHE